MAVSSGDSYLSCSTMSLPALFFKWKGDIRNSYMDVKYGSCGPCADRGIEHTLLRYPTLIAERFSTCYQSAWNAFCYNLLNKLQS